MSPHPPLSLSSQTGTLVLNEWLSIGVQLVPHQLGARARFHLRLAAHRECRSVGACLQSPLDPAGMQQQQREHLLIHDLPTEFDTRSFHHRRICSIRLTRADLRSSSRCLSTSSTHRAPPSPTDCCCVGANPALSCSLALLSVRSPNRHQLRDWNEEYQQFLDLPQTTLQERLFRDHLLHKLHTEFLQVAARGVVYVIRVVCVCAHAC